jgi:3-oxoacyl-[acyl-carrier-protein] synthase-3
MAVPERVVPNSWFEARLDTDDEWIRSRTGIRERRFAEVGESTSDYAAAAGRQALERSGVPLAEIGLVVVATSVPDVRIPSTANLVAEKLGLGSAFAYDISAACCGFLFAYSAAESQLRAGLARYALVIGADLYSSIMDMEDRGTCVLFGDGAGAAVIGRSDAKRGVIRTHLQSESKYASVLGCSGGGTAGRTSPCARGNEAGRIHMQGPRVFRLAVAGCCSAIRQVLRRAKLKATDIDRIVPHQANLRIIHKIAETFGYPMEQIEVNLDRYGNTSAASIPIALHEAVESGRIRSGNLILFVAAGAGFNSGAMLIRV